jgi:hypothetical protein
MDYHQQGERQMNLLFLDCEIARCIPSHRIADDPETDPDQSDRMMYQFCHGWTDFSGMGISCVTTFSTVEARAHVYLRDNLAELIESIRAHDHVVTFNGDRFDIPLLRANDIMVHQHIDLAKVIWSACGIANGEHPLNLGLNALPGKSNRRENGQRSERPEAVSRWLLRPTDRLLPGRHHRAAAALAQH